MTCTQELVVKRLREGPATEKEIAIDTDSALSTVAKVLSRMRKWDEVKYTEEGKKGRRARIWHLNGGKNESKPLNNIKRVKIGLCKVEVSGGLK